MGNQLYAYGFWNTNCNKTKEIEELIRRFEQHIRNANECLWNLEKSQQNLIKCQDRNFTKLDTDTLSNAKREKLKTRNQKLRSLIGLLGE